MNDQMHKCMSHSNGMFGATGPCLWRRSRACQEIQHYTAEGDGAPAGSTARDFAEVILLTLTTCCQTYTVSVKASMHILMLYDSCPY